MLGIPIASMIGGIATPAGSSINQMGLDMIEANGGARIPFLHWMVLGVPMMIVLMPIAILVLLWFYPPEIKSIGSLEDIKRDLAKLGPITAAEWKTIILMSSMLVLWMLGTFYPTSIFFNVYVVSLVGAILMFIPGIGLFTWKEAQAAIGWDTLLLIMGITALGNASSSTGLAKWLANVAFGDLAGQSLLVIWRWRPPQEQTARSMHCRSSSRPPARFCFLWMRCRSSRIPPAITSFTICGSLERSSASSGSSS
jgi:sodium-dependent dicarboxylate transporter 2/3/5